MGRPKGPLITQICIGCGEEFSRIPSVAKKLKYCSRRCYQPSFRSPLEARLWPYIQKGLPDECWPWIGCRDKDGYGKLKVNGYTKKAHRLVWEVENRLLEDDEEVCHSCDSPPCCNPRHLFIGTSQDNRDDCVEKRRHAHGERNGGAKLSPEDVEEIKRLNLLRPRQQKMIASQFNISLIQVNRIVNDRAWRLVENG